MIEQVLITTTADNSQAENQYKGLRTEIKDLKKELDLLEEGTAEYDAVFSKLSAKMKILQDRTRALRTSSSADLGDVLGNSTKVLGTLSQGVAGATAALSLFGIENEALLKNIQRVQAFEAIARSFTAFEDTITKTLPALKNNIMGFFKDTSKLKLNLEVEGGDIKTPQGVTQKVKIDTEGFENAAKSSQVIAGANLSAAGAATNNAAQQGLITNENTKQLALEKAKNVENSKALLLKKAELAELEMSAITLGQMNKAADAQNAKRRLEDEYQTKFTREQLKNLPDSPDKTTALYDGYNKATNAQQKLREEAQKYREEAEKIGDVVDDNAQKTTALGKETTWLGKIWGNLKGIISGVGIGLAIGAAIAGITYLINKFKELNAEIKKSNEDRIKYNDELSKSQGAAGKELATLQTLQVGYNSLSNDRKKQLKFLEDNKDTYKKIGIEIDKLPNKEKAFTAAVAKTNTVLIERAKNMGRVNLLMAKYGEQFDLQTKKDLAQEDLRNIILKESAFSIDEKNNKGLIDYIALAYAGGTVNVENLTKMVIARFPNLKDETKYLTDSFEVINNKYGLFLKNTNENAVQLENVNKTIVKLSEGIQPFKLEDDKGADGLGKQVTVLKSYSELLADINELYKGIDLNNPFTPEKLRQAEDSFNKVKIAAEESIKVITQNENLSNEERLFKISETNQLVIQAEKQLIQVKRQIQLDNAKWERDNQLRVAKEQQAIQKNNYKQTIEDAQASLKAGVINIEKFAEIFKSVQNAAGTSFNTVKEFFDYLGGNEIVNRNDKFTSGIDEIIKGFTSIDNGVENIDIEGVKNKIKEKFGTNIDVKTPLAIDLGNLSIDEFNYLQKLLGLYDDYNKSKQDIIINSNEETKENTQKGYDEQLDLLDKLLADSERKIDANNAKLRTGINERSALGVKEAFQGIRSGYQNILDEISILKNEITNEDNVQAGINARIEILNKELEAENITLERRIEINDQLKQLDADLTASEEIESEKRLAVKEKERDIRQQIFDGTVQGLEDVTTILSNIYEASETNELNNLKKLLNAKTITQEQYEEKSEALANEYAKKRKRIEIFQGLLAATASSIGAFSSAMRPDSGIPYPYNLIAAGVSSAAAFSAVIAQVATLKSLSIGDTSVTPTSTTSGGGLNYTLQEQQVSNERLINSLTSQRVYVLESDITSTQARVTQVEEMSTF